MRYNTYAYPEFRISATADNYSFLSESTRESQQRTTNERNNDSNKHKNEWKNEEKKIGMKIYIYATTTVNAAATKSGSRKKMKHKYCVFAPFIMYDSAKENNVMHLFASPIYFNYTN